MNAEITKYDYPFGKTESDQAYLDWGANCGPNALAFALQIPIGEIKDVIIGFDKKRYTTATMMKTTLQNLGKPYEQIIIKDYQTQMFHPNVALIRIQWHGSWNKSIQAAKHTHWIAAWQSPNKILDHDGKPTDKLVFDINSGITAFNTWTHKTIPYINQTCEPKMNGNWNPTHILRLT